VRLRCRCFSQAYRRESSQIRWQYGASMSGWVGSASAMPVFLVGVPARVAVRSDGSTVPACRAGGSTTQKELVDDHMISRSSIS
jgi:hypothetical protein